MSSNLTDDEVREAAAFLSTERLTAFVQLAGSDRDAIALHHQTMQLGAALMPVTGMIEVVLRNAICERLRHTFGHPDWLTNPPPPFAWKGEEENNIKNAGRMARRAAYAKLSQTEKRKLDALAYPNGVPAGLSHEAHSKARQKVVPITQGQLIAQLTLFFWKRLFSPDYDATLWQRSLRGLFPNKALSRTDISANLETLYQARNRIAHHEPVMKARLARVIAAADFVALNFHAKTPSEDAILAKMTAPYRQALKTEAAALDALLARFTVTPSAP